VAVADASAALLPMESTQAIEWVADSALPASAEAVFDSPTAPEPEVAPQAEAVASPSRGGWLDRLKSGLKKTGSSITTVFTGTRIDEALYEELETALLLADTGVPATEHLLAELRRRVKDARASEPAQVKVLLQDAIAELLGPLEKALVVGVYHPTVIMVAGVNGAGKTTSIGKLTKHLADAGASVLLAAADTFAPPRASSWPCGPTATGWRSSASRAPTPRPWPSTPWPPAARRLDVVLVDTAGRLPTQKHLMEELTKIRRVVTKADITAPHEVLLVIDGNTGQNALAQVKAFDEAIGLTGLIVTKLDGTAKGGVLCAIAREKPLPVYFIGVGEKLEDLQTFKAREFAQALVG
jgi:fused signal recognition particle receptor